MLNSITCDTDPNEIIKESDISGILSELETTTNDYYKKVQSSITQEQAGGGLSSKAFYIGDKPLLKEDSDRIIDDMQVKNEYTTLRSDIEEALKTQRQAEINRLLEKIDEKIKSLEAELSTIPSYGILDIFNRNSENAARRRALEDKINHYKSKRNQVGGMA